MSSRHSRPPSPVIARLRIVVIVLVAVFIAGFILMRGRGETAETTTSAPEAGATTTPDDSTETTEPSETTLPGSTETTNPLPPLQGFELEVIDADYRQPTVITAPEGDDRLFVVQRVGVIRIIDSNNEMLDPAFLAIDDRVLAGGIEQGLLGLDFHPDFAQTGRFYVYYTDRGGRRQLSEFTVSADDPNVADPASERVIFEREQPPNATDIRHYAGQVHFGPDGYLYVSLGDGADSRAQAQDPDTFFGTILRIDVDGGDPYGVPSDNPFVGGGGAPEVWAYGLRNPWRFSIDPVDGLVYIADVGHADQEEINVVSLEGGGYNFGWSDMEGTRCFHKTDCDPADYTAPVITYNHEDSNCSVTGGFVYRGVSIPELVGTYFYSDWCAKWIKSFKFVDGEVTEERDWTDELGELGQVNSFGVGGDGELYLVTFEGTVAKLVATR